MRWGKKKGRIAAGFSVSLHAAVYLGLAAGGFFTVLQHYSRQPNVTDVMIYNSGDMAGAGGSDADGTDAVSRDGGGDYDQRETVASTPEKAPTPDVTPASEVTPPTPGALTYAAAQRESQPESSDEKGTPEPGAGCGPKGRRSSEDLGPDQHFRTASTP